MVDGYLENSGAEINSTENADLIKNFKEMFKLLASTKEIDEALSQLSKEAKSPVQ
jgi:hypothetical protein